jgi:hypothetical protein
MVILPVVSSILTVPKVSAVLAPAYNLLSFVGEQGFHETITPSLTQDVEHVTLFTDLPPFRCSDDTVMTQFTNDTFLMDSLCDDILEKANASPSQLHVMAVAIQSNISMGIDAIQLRTSSSNIVFRVILLFFEQKS